MPFSFHIRHLGLAMLALVFFSLFIGLGSWQLQRAQQKKRLLQSFQARTRQAALTAQALHHDQDMRFYRAILKGQFDNDHTFLLDNKIFHGKVGYEVYTPFQVEGLPIVILVDRGFIPINTRSELPIIHRINGTITVVGMLNRPPTYVAWGPIYEAGIKWPLRIEFVDLATLSELTGRPFYPYVLSLAPSDPAAYDIEWQIVTMTPERHTGYAIQWFALALTLLILFVALNRDPRC